MIKISVQKARHMMDQICRDVNDSHEPVLITCNAKNAVVLSEEDWMILAGYYCAKTGSKLDDFIRKSQTV